MLFRSVRPALQLVKTKKTAHLVSSSFILVRGEEKLAMGDCAINIDYQDTVDKEGNVTYTAAQKLAEVAIETAKTAEIFGIEPKVAMLSFSTNGSGKGGTVKLSHDATIAAKEMAPDLLIDGEMQFDAAVAPEVGQLKFPGSKVAGYALKVGNRKLKQSQGKAENLKILCCCKIQARFRFPENWPLSVTVCI